MSNIQIPNLPAAIALNGGELLEAVQSGVSVRITTAQLGVLLSAMANATILGQYNTSLPSYTDGSSTTIQTDANGRLLVAGSGTAGAPAGGVITVQPPPLTSGSVTIAASASLSNALDCTTGRAVGIVIPSDLKGITILSAQGSYDGATYSTLCNIDGSEWNISVSVSAFVPLDFSLFGPVNYIKIRGGTLGTPQTATATNLVLTIVKAP